MPNRMEVRLKGASKNTVILNGKELNQLVALKIESDDQYAARVSLTLLVDELVTMGDDQTTQTEIPPHSHISNGAGACEVCGKSLVTLLG